MVNVRARLAFPSNF